MCGHQPLPRCVCAGSVTHTHTHIDRCVLALYFATGVAMLKWQEGWEVTTAIYVVVQVVTTVGQALRDRFEILRLYGEAAEATFLISHVHPWFGFG